LAKPQNNIYSKLVVSRRWRVVSNMRPQNTNK